MKINPDIVDNIEVRPLTKDDYQELLELQYRCFGDMEPTTEAQFESQLYQFQ
jgi:hypothetical protein